MDNLKFDERGNTIIPEGYKWCQNCEALTPHKEKREWFIEFHCEVCGHEIYSSLACPKCGCMESEDFCEPAIIIRHREPCHDNDMDGFIANSYSDSIMQQFAREFMKSAPDRSSYILPRDEEWYFKNRRLHQQLDEYEKRTKCRCPRFIIYRNINQTIVESHSYFNGDYVCHWGKYKVKCRICGYFYEREDSD